MYFSIPAEHLIHWMEPQTITATRAPEEKYCESCGEEIPWHNNRCRLLKNAYQRRNEICTWCPKVFEVGVDMFEHVTTTHMDEIRALGIQVQVKR